MEGLKHLVMSGTVGWNHKANLHCFFGRPLFPGVFTAVLAGLASAFFAGLPRFFGDAEADLVDPFGRPRPTTFLGDGFTFFGLTAFFGDFFFRATRTPSADCGKKYA